MQGKPLNAMRASRAEVERYPLYRELLCALGYASEPGAATGRQIAPAAARYEKVILLFDPDADGIHCGALLLMLQLRHCLRLRWMDVSLT